EQMMAREHATYLPRSPRRQGPPCTAPGFEYELCVPYPTPLKLRTQIRCLHRALCARSARAAVRESRRSCKPRIRNIPTSLPERRCDLIGDADKLESLQRWKLRV